jgi:hypothetical protein
MRSLPPPDDRKALLYEPPNQLAVLESRTRLSRPVKLLCGSAEFAADACCLLKKTRFYRGNVITLSDYEIRSSVKPDSVASFIQFLEQDGVSIDSQNALDLRNLAAEFRFDALTEKVDRFLAGNPHLLRRRRSPAWFMREKRERFGQRLTSEIPVPISRDLERLYKRLAAAHHAGDVTAIFGYLSKLAAFAADNYVDVDLPFSETGMFEMLPRFLGGEAAICCAAVAFLANVFQAQDTFLIGSAKALSWVPLIARRATSGGPELAVVGFRCLANIAADSAGARDAVLAELSIDRAVGLVRHRYDQAPKVQKMIVRLIGACAAFPGADDLEASVLHALLDLLEDTLSARLPFAHITVAGLAILAREPVRVVEGLSTHANIVQRLLRARGTDGAKIVRAALALLHVLVENGGLPEPADLIEYDWVLDLVDGSESIVCGALRLLANIAGVASSLHDWIIGRLDRLWDLLDKAAAVRIETVFLVTAVIRVGTGDIARAFVENDFEFVRQFVDVLETEEPDVCHAALAAIAAFFRLHVQLPGVAKAARTQFFDAGGEMAIATLMESDAESVAELAATFDSLFIHPPPERVPFKFT